jgi:acetoin utilization deacetylase AcuC-like enzyme
MTPIFFHLKQRSSYDFVSLSKIPMFVDQSMRLPKTDFEPLKDQKFMTVHAPKYVHNVFSLRTVNGFGNRNPSVNESLRYSNASFLNAANYVLDDHPVACSASQGFHHAHFDNGYGYCTFNGLMIAAAHVAEWAQKVLIIDGDAHMGDGTDDIIEYLRLEKQVVNVTKNRGFSDRMAGWNENMWHQWANDLLSHHAPGIIFYQAGADAWDQDPYNAGYLSLEGLAMRDRAVFTAARDFKIPLVWNLAGGYSHPTQKVVDIHLQTLNICDEVYYGEIGLPTLPGEATNGGGQDARGDREEGARSSEGASGQA